MELILVGWDLNTADTSDTPIDWDAVEARARSHPREAMERLNMKEYQTIDDNWTEFHDKMYPFVLMLHCDGLTLGAVEAVYDAYPAAIFSYTNNGFYPLEIYYGVDDGGPGLDADPVIARSLLVKYFEARKHRKRVRRSNLFLFEGGFVHNPLYGVDSRYCSVAVAKALLEEYPSGGTKADPDIMRSPLVSILNDITNDYNAPSQEDPFDEMKRYEKLKYILQAHQHSTVGARLEDKGIVCKTLHSFLWCISSSQVPHAFEYGDSMGRGRVLGEFMAAKEKDGSNMFPSIHTSLLRILKLMKDDNRDQFRQADEEGKNPIQVMLQDDAPPSMSQRAVETTVAIHRFLLGEFPESISVPDERGRLPLHYAIENKWPIGAVLESYPAGASTRDPVSGLHPFQLAGVAGSLDSCFDLLVKEPSLIG